MRRLSTRSFDSVSYLSRYIALFGVLGYRILYLIDFISLFEPNFVVTVTRSSIERLGGVPNICVVLAVQYFCRTARIPSLTDNFVCCVDSEF